MGSVALGDGCHEKVGVPVVGSAGGGGCHEKVVGVRGAVDVAKKKVSGADGRESSLFEAECLLCDAQPGGRLRPLAGACADKGRLRPDWSHQSWAPGPAIWPPKRFFL